MAITSSITIKSTAAEIPDGYTIPVLTVISGEESTFNTDIAISSAHISNAVTGVTQVIAAVKAFFDTDYGPNTLKLDTLKTITANLYITSITRKNTASSIFLTGTEVFNCEVRVVYN